MPKGVALEIVQLASLSETEIKKESETATTELFKPGAGRTWRLTNFVLGASAETTVTIEDETTAICVVLIAAKTTVVVDLSSLVKSGLLSKAAGNKLKIKSLNTAKFSGSFYGLESDT